MIQKLFAEKVSKIVAKDETLIGLAVAGSWLTNEIDEFSDLDLILVTKEKITDDKTRMIDYASQYGPLLSAFTGEHVGEPRLLICLYNDPLLHVDIKFVTLQEFGERIETPVLLSDSQGLLQQVIDQTEPKFPYPDFQWIEDRFWTWIHYALLKVGRGEYFEALDFIAYLRMMVFGPLLHIKNGNLPRGVRKAETQLNFEDIEDLKLTVGALDKAALIAALENSITLYLKLRRHLFDATIDLHEATKDKVIQFLLQIKERRGD